MECRSQTEVFRQIFGLLTVIAAYSNDFNTNVTGQFSSLRIKGASILSNGSSQFLFFVLRI